MPEGLVMKSTGSHYIVRLPNGEAISCTARGKLRLRGSTTTNPVVVGDRVEVELQPTGGLITAIKPRSNYVIRRSTNLSRETHIIAANLDQALLVVTVAQPETHLGFIDRYTVAAEAYGVPVVLLFNKTDICTQSPLKELLSNYIELYTHAGYRCLSVSAQTGEGLAELRELVHGRVSLISGNSGVGKSSLLNRIEGRQLQRTEAISAAHQTGKHTTTFSEMFELADGGYIIDTPGIKGFGLVDIDRSELARYFPDLFAHAASCRFHNCTHTHEPSCAVRNAVEQGQIEPTRYENYLSIYYGEDDKYR